MNTMERRVHPNCIFKSNPYHECIEACFDRMPNPPNKKSGGSLMILVVPKRLSFRKKNKESADKITNLKSSSLDSPSSSPVQFSFNKVESWDCDVTTLSHQNPLQLLSFLPKEEEEDSTKKQHTSKVVSSKQEEVEEEGLKEFDSMRSTLTVTDQSTEEEEEEESNTDPDCRVAVGNYFVKESVSGILASILNKYGDIAERCKLESVALRSYYLECVCFIILELLQSPVIQLRETKFKEMLSIVKDAGCVGIDVGWLSPVVDRMGKVMELIKQRNAFQAEKRQFFDSDAVRKELQLQLQVLGEKEEAATMARARLEDIQGQFRELEEECFNLRERMMIIESKLVETVDYKSLYGYSI